MATVTPIQTAKPNFARNENYSPARDGLLWGTARLGLLLLDSTQAPISFNTEALQVLAYADGLESTRAPEFSLANMVRAKLLSRLPSNDQPFVSEFRSGRRRYFCRLFPLTSLATDPSVPNAAVILERGASGFVFLPKIAQRFHLTIREQEVLEFLLQGLETKAIASRMSISPNTVKTFLRLIKGKMEVSSRSAIVAKVMMSPFY